MEDRIIKLSKSGNRASKHVVPRDVYLKENIIDIGVNSTSRVSKNFNIKNSQKQ